MFKSFPILKLSFTFALMLMFSFQLFAQVERYQIGRAPQKDKVERIDQHFIFPTEVNVGYGNDAIAGPFVSVPIPAGTPINTIGGNFPAFLAGGDFNDAGVYYACTYGGALGVSSLVTVDITTGAATTIGSITGISQYATALDFNTANDTWYYGETDGVTSKLYTVDVSTGAATYVGDLTGLGALIGMAIDCSGNAYGVDINSNQLFSINLATAVSSPIGALGFDPSYAQDADFDASTGTMYLAAYNFATSTGEFRSVDLTTGLTSFITSWGGVEIDGFAIDNGCGAPCPIDPPTNPNPPNGALNVPLNPGNATWTNGAGATSIEVYFGVFPALSLVYSGPPITSYAIPGPLNYYTEYGWRVVGFNDTCNVSGPTWKFKTMQNPNVIFQDEFPDFSQWTAVGPLGLGNWITSASNTAGGLAAPELAMTWSPSFNGESRIRSIVINAPNSTPLTFTFNWFFDWYANPSGTITFSATYDGGATRTTLWSIADPTGNVGPVQEIVNFTSPASGSSNLQLELTFTGNSFNNDNIYWDDMLLVGEIPVELTSFAAVTDNRNVTLNWSTATELNNSGFQVERSSGSEYQSVGFIAGHGTTTEIQNYSFVDQNVVAGNYSYRLKQIDFNGNFEYSNVVEVEVLGVKEFTLGQNYPNPFNPSTTINFSLAVDSKVSLKIFDVLGQEVATLVNGQLAAGSQKVSFDASSLNSGVYFYRIDANGNDGQKFSSTRKMILTK
jgi:hypothetical protein